MKINVKKGMKKCNFNDKYIQILKKLHIENIIYKGKLQPNQFPFTEKPTLYDYLLDKHALLYERFNLENKGFLNPNIPFSLNKTNTNSKENSSPSKIQSFRMETNPSKTSIFNQSNQTKIDIGKKLKKFGSSKKLSIGGVKQPNAQENKKGKAQEYVEVSFYDETQNSRQYYKVCIVPLILQEPLLAISMEDITFTSFYHQKMKQTKQNLILNSLSFYKLKQKIDNVINDIISLDQIKIKKEIIFISHIIRAFTKIDPLKITFQSFSVNCMMNEIQKLFPCILKIQYKNESSIPIIVGQKQVEVEEEKFQAQKPQISLTNSPAGLFTSFYQKDNEMSYLQIKKSNLKILPNSDLVQFKLPNQNIFSPLHKSKDNINGLIYNHLNQQCLINKDKKINSQNQFVNKQSIFGNYKGKNITNQNNLDQLNEINQVMFSHSNTYINTDIGDYQDHERNQFNKNSSCNSPLDHLTIMKKNNHKRLMKRTLSQHIPFSQECRTLEKVNTFCNIINHQELAIKENIHINVSPIVNYQIHEQVNSIDTQVSSPRIRSNSQHLNTNNYTEEDLNEKDNILINKQNLVINQTQINIESQLYFTPQKKQNTFCGFQEVEKQNIVTGCEEQNRISQEFYICNNENMIHYVLIGVISMFKENNIEIEISLNQSNLYKSLKISIMPSVKMTLSKRLQFFQPETVYNQDDIYDLRSQDDTYSFSQLSQKMFQRLNEICLLLGPNKIKLEPDIIEVEFFAEQNKISLQKNQI